MIKDDISAEELRKLLRYEPETGKLFWLPRPADMFASVRDANAWNARFAGSEAFISTDKDGYRRGAIFCRRHFAHRIIWLFVYGEWPVEQIDHINGDTSDNRLENLREATRSENSMNQRRPSNNTSGFKGVYWHKKRHEWRAAIQVYGVKKHLGVFNSAEDAYDAYVSAAKVHHGAYARVA